ncbi:hypothetical protein [uncultured Methylobacterium sp.]|jgi:hypothetical protein|uniref:hypothetical protein n=1 Tax=uncultured Methylobacterium sp. TaxID=157278 RepID=UPI00260FA87D|nr:hypothetical protein [uncultured Methylobacterium sp.]
MLWFRYTERLATGDYVYAHMTEAEREAFRQFMRAADGSDTDDPGYCDLGNFSIGCCVEPDEPIEERNVQLQIEYMARARLLEGTMERADWGYLLSLAAGGDKAGAARLAKLFETASGIGDEEAFDEDLRPALREEWMRQTLRLQALGHLQKSETTAVPARPILMRWVEEGGPLPVLEDEEQLALQGVAED